MFHKDVSPSDNHIVHAWAVADESARLALSPTLSDVGKICWQQDIDALWLLKDVSPVSWVSLSGAQQTAKYSIVGALTLSNGTARFYPDRDIVVSKVYFSLGTTGAGTAEIDVRKNGVSIFSGSRPQCIAGSFKSTVVSVLASVTTADYLTVTPTMASGADATVFIVYS